MHARHANSEQRRYQRIAILSVSVILATALGVLASYIYAPSVEETSTPPAPFSASTPSPIEKGKIIPEAIPTVDPTTRLVSHLLTPSWIKSSAQFVKPTRPPARPATTVPSPSKAAKPGVPTTPARSKPTPAPSSHPTSAPTSAPSSTISSAPTTSTPTSDPVIPTPAGTLTPTVTPSSADPVMLP